MATKSKFQAIRGTRDLLPPETELWNHVEQTAREVFGTFGFGEIRPPIFEPTELFARAVGGETDMVSKEMYNVESPLVEEISTLVNILNEPRDWTVHLTVLESYYGIAERLRQRLDVAIRSGEFPRPERESVPQRMELAMSILGHACGKVAGGLVGELTNKDPNAVEGAILGIRALTKEIEFPQSNALRPEATASVCRAYIEHNMQQLPQPVKLYYMGPMFRRERPQKGRYRQFYQIGAEVLEKQVANENPERGATAIDQAKELAKDSAVDAEVIEMVMTFFDRLQLPGVQLDINSIGHNADNCRRGYVAQLKSALEKVKDKLGADSQRRIETNPLRVLDSKLEHEQPIIETLPRIADHLCDDCKAHYAAVKRQLELRGVLYKENWRLVRGLDYYMRTTFEITASGLGSQNAVCGGGRYDGLVELLGGPPTKGIGFAIGEDRLILSLQEQAKEVASGPDPDKVGAGRVGVNEWPATAGKRVASTGRDVYIAWMGEHAHATAIRAAKHLRAAGIRVELPPAEQKFGKALGQADKLGAKYALILGDNEVAEGLWTLKTLADGSQQKFTEPQLLEFLKRSL